MNAPTVLRALHSREVDEHLIGLSTGKVIEFQSPEIEKSQIEIASELGYELKGYKLELFGKPIRR